MTWFDNIRDAEERRLQLDRDQFWACLAILISGIALVAVLLWVL